MALCVCVSDSIVFFEMNEKQGAGVNVFSLMCRNTHTQISVNTYNEFYSEHRPQLFFVYQLAPTHLWREVEIDSWFGVVNPSWNTRGLIATTHHPEKVTVLVN